MYVEADGVAEETSLEIGFLELLSQGDVSDAVNEQFDYPIVSGLVLPLTPRRSNHADDKQPNPARS
jgi:hypothetical protein